MQDLLVASLHNVLRILLIWVWMGSATRLCAADTEGPASDIKSWSWIGIPSPDEMTLGMWSHHFVTTSTVERHNLCGLQCHGLYLNTFINSHGHRCVWGGVAREWYRYTWPGTALRLRLGYRLGPVYGYREGIPRIGRWSIIPAIEPSLDWHRVGICFEILPAYVVAVRCFISSF